MSSSDNWVGEEYEPSESRRDDVGGEKGRQPWTEVDINRFYDALSTYGRDLDKLAQVCDKTIGQTRGFFYRSVKKINKALAPMEVSIDPSNHSEAIYAILGHRKYELQRKTKFGKRRVHGYKLAEAVLPAERFQVLMWKRRRVRPPKAKKRSRKGKKEMLSPRIGALENATDFIDWMKDCINEGHIPQSRFMEIAKSIKREIFQAVASDSEDQSEEDEEDADPLADDAVQPPTTQSTTSLAAVAAANHVNKLRSDLPPLSAQSVDEMLRKAAERAAMHRSMSIPDLKKATSDPDVCNVKLTPRNSAVQHAVEDSGFNPRLRVVLPKSKTVRFVINHIVRKWQKKDVSIVGVDCAMFALASDTSIPETVTMGQLIEKLSKTRSFEIIEGKACLTMDYEWSIAPSIVTRVDELLPRVMEPESDAKVEWLQLMDEIRDMDGNALGMMLERSRDAIPPNTPVKQPPSPFKASPRKRIRMESIDDVPDRVRNEIHILFPRRADSSETPVHHATKGQVHILQAKRKL